MQHRLSLKRKKNHKVKPKTYKKVKALSGKKLVNTEGKEAMIEYFVHFKPVDSAFVIAGQCVSLRSTGKDRESFDYVGEKGFKKMLKEWKEA